MREAKEDHKEGLNLIKSLSGAIGKYETHRHSIFQRTGLTLWTMLAEGGFGSGRRLERGTGAWNRYDA